MRMPCLLAHLVNTEPPSHSFPGISPVNNLVFSPPTLRLSSKKAAGLTYDCHDVKLAACCCIGGVLLLRFWGSTPGWSQLPSTGASMFVVRNQPWKATVVDPPMIGATGTTGGGSTPSGTRNVDGRTGFSFFRNHVGLSLGWLDVGRQGAGAIKLPELRASQGQWFRNAPRQQDVFDWHREVPLLLGLWLHPHTCTETPYTYGCFSK